MKKKRAKKNQKNILIISTIILVLLVCIFLIFKNSLLTTKVIEQPPTPEDCSNESIKEVWEFIFKGSSENLIIVAPNETIREIIINSKIQSLNFGKEVPIIEGCPVYAIYQINGNNVKMVSAWDKFLGFKMISGTNGEYSQEDIEKIYNASQKPIGLDITISTSDAIFNLKRETSISNSEEAKKIFESIFNVSSSNWTTESYYTFVTLENGTRELQEVIGYSFGEKGNETNISLFGEQIEMGNVVFKLGNVEGNTSLEYYTYAEETIWSRLKQLEKQFKNWDSPINTSLKNVDIQINNSNLELLKNYENIQKVKIIQNNQIIIETEINFTEANFDWTKIILKKQEVNSSKGYVIINGLNYTKNVTVDRLSNESESVCIKNKEINSIDEISENCNAIDEYLLECPGNLSNNAGNFTCTVSGNKFVVTGLKHSAILEMIPEIEQEPCIPNWTCEEWNEYQDQCGYRLCTDLNNCMNDSTRPLEFKECPVCIPNWECTEFLPEKCPKEERRTRNCIDLNNCGTEQGKPRLTENCERKNNLIWIILGILIAGIILIGIILLIKKNKNKLEDNPPLNQSLPKYPSQPPVKQGNYPNKQNSNLQNNDPKQGYYYPKEY